MTSVFLTLLNMSITASWTALAVMLLRLLLKKTSRGLLCTLWGLVALRLICPLSIESILSLIPSAQTVPQEIIYAETPAIDSGIPMINSTFNPALAQSLSPQAGASVNPMQIVVAVFSNVWLLGMIVMVVYMLVSTLRVCRQVGASLNIDGRVYLCDNIDSPFILGILRPRIFLPSSLPEDSKAYVIAHEQAHLRRFDHLWKPLGFLLLCVYWFNPVMWIAYVLLCRDIELACDERVMKGMNKEDIASYTEALLHCGTKRKAITACPLAFGEVGVKTRIKAALHYKKPAFWITAIAVVASLAVTVCFLTNPPDKSSHVHGSELEGLWLEMESLTSGDDPKLTLRWHNDSDRDLIFGESFTLYRQEDGQSINCYLLGEAYFNMIGIGLSAGDSREHTYNLQHYDLSKNGTYRFESNCHDRDSGDIYRVWIEFEYKTREVDRPHDKYVMADSVEGVAPYVALSEDGDTFWFYYSVFSSHLAHGSCERNGDTLILHDENGEDFVFTHRENTLVFHASLSDPLPTYATGAGERVSIPDNAMFVNKEAKADPANNTTKIPSQLIGPSVMYDRQNDEYQYEGPFILDEKTACIVADAVLLKKDPKIAEDFPIIKATYHADARSYVVMRVNDGEDTGARVELNAASMFGTGLQIENVTIRNRPITSFVVTSKEQAQIIGEAILSSIYGIYGKSNKSIKDTFPLLLVDEAIVFDSDITEWLVLRQDDDDHHLYISISVTGRAEILFWHDIDETANKLIMPERIEINDYTEDGTARYTITPESHNVVRIQQTSGEVHHYTLSKAEIKTLNQLYASITDFGSDEIVYVDGEPVSARHDVFLLIDGERQSYIRGHARQPQLDEYIDTLISFYRKGVHVWY